MTELNWARLENASTRLAPTDGEALGTHVMAWPLLEQDVKPEHYPF